jgi:hypothetical protein
MPLKEFMLQERTPENSVNVQLISIALRVLEVHLLVQQANIPMDNQADLT